MILEIFDELGEDGFEVLELGGGGFGGGFRHFAIRVLLDLLRCG